MPDISTLEKFAVDVPQATLEDLHERLRRTRWAPDPDNEDMHYGVSTAYLQSLVDYWLNEFDWRKAEARINEYDQYRVTIDDQPVHFIREPGKGPNPIPLLVMHGWPWSFWDLHKVIKPLADPAAFGGDPNDAFEVIVPSLAGFGFSTPARGDMNHWKMGDIFNVLMTEVLGFPKFAVSAADYGALVGTHLGHKYADNLYGVHLGHDLFPGMFNGDTFWDLAGEIPPDLPPDLHKEFLKFQETYFSHVAAHMLDAQPLTLGLNDSPVGMLAWILQRWRKWSDKNAEFESVYSRDHILTNAMIYWVTESIGSSIRSYRNAHRYPWAPSHDRTPLIQAPAGFTFLLGDAYPPGATVENRVDLFKNGPTAEFYNVAYAKAHPSGGHFVHFENPEAVIEDVRALYRGLR